MIESTEEIYENIAGNIRKGIAEPWEQAELRISVTAHNVSYKGNYIHGDKQGAIQVSAFDRTLDDDMHKLHELTTADTHNKLDNWHDAVFTLYNKDGHYEIRFLPKTE